MKTDTDDYFISYEEWREAITKRCGIALSREYCDERIHALQDPDDSSTTQFIDLFGLAYRDKVIRWFQRAGAGS